MHCFTYSKWFWRSVAKNLLHSPRHAQKQIPSFPSSFGGQLQKICSSPHGTAMHCLTYSKWFWRRSVANDLILSPRHCNALLHLFQVVSEQVSCKGFAPLPKTLQCTVSPIPSGFRGQLQRICFPPQGTAMHCFTYSRWFWRRSVTKDFPPSPRH